MYNFLSVRILISHRGFKYPAELNIWIEPALVLQRVDPLRAKFKIFLVKCIFNGIDLGRVTLNYDTTFLKSFHQFGHLSIKLYFSKRVNDIRITRRTEYNNDSE